MPLERAIRDPGNWISVFEASPPAAPDALLGVAALWLGHGEAAAAARIAGRGCQVAPHHAAAWSALGLALLQDDRPAEAEEAFAEATRLAPARADHALHRAEAALRAGAVTAALERLQAAIARDPLDVGALTARGYLLEQTGQRQEAIDLLEAAVTLAPAAPLPAALLGSVLARAHRPAEAAAALRRAVALDPGNPQLRNDLAAVLMRMHRHAAAAAELRTVLAGCAGAAGALCNLATATVSLGDQDAALALARQAIGLDPHAMLPWRTLANTLPYAADCSPAALMAALKGCADRLPRGAPHSWANVPDPDRRLRVGLLSGALRTHPVGWLTVAGFETLDPAHFELICLVQNAGSDPIARRFRTCAAEWHAIDALDDAALATVARSAGIDVLIDLGGYGDLGRLAACARRLAPVQVKWVGMQTHSTNLPEIDWIITDRWETPPELEHLYSERPLRLADGYVCYSPPAYAPPVAPAPLLANDFPTFGCFNNLAKITPPVIATWSRILHAVPQARLVLKTHQFSEPETVARVIAAFGAHAIAASRIELRGASGHREFMRQYNDIDLVLDPFPYSGGLTTCEALWMGVPTLTLPGSTFASRHSASHMSNAGLDDWLAADLEDYVAQAVARVADPAALIALRAGLRERVKASPLCDAPRFGRSLGAALRHAWAAWCRTR